MFVALLVLELLLYSVFLVIVSFFSAVDLSAAATLNPSSCA